MRYPLILLGIACTLVAPSASAQATLQFRARLAPVPIDIVMQEAIAGRGTVMATLKGTALAITGTFADLKAPATFAKIHRGPKGIRGPAVLDLTLSKGTAGTLAGTFDLTSEQIDDLRSGRLYIQLHSEKAPEGNLWGWLLPQQGRR